MKLVISAVIWDAFLRAGMPQKELIRLAARYECAGVEFRPYWHDFDNELPEIKKQLAEYGQVCTYAGTEALLADTEDAVRLSLHTMAGSITMAARLGAPILRINVANGPFKPDFVKAAWWQKEVKDILHAAAGQGITLAVENATNPEAGDAGLLRHIFAVFDSKRLRLTFDTGNWLLAGQEPEQALDMLKEYIGYVHLKDILATADGLVACHPGSGMVDIVRLVDKLGAVGYQGLYALEFSGGGSPERCVEQSLKYLNIAQW